MEQDKRKKRIIIALVILAIIAIVMGIWWITRSGSATKDSTKTKTGVDLGQLDPNNRLNPDGTPIGSGSYGNENGSNNSDGTDGKGNKYSTIGYGFNGTDTNGSGNGNGTGGGTGGSDLNGGTDTSGGDLVDITGGGGNGNNTGGNQGGGNAGTDPCVKPYGDMSSIERAKCIGTAGAPELVEDNSLELTADQKLRLDELNRIFYRNAPLLASPDIVDEFKDQTKDYLETHRKISKLIWQCQTLIDDPDFQRVAGNYGILGRTFYRGNPKNGYTPGTNRTSGNPVWRPVVLGQMPYGIAPNTKDPITGNYPYNPNPYYYLTYYKDNGDPFSHRGGASFTTWLEDKIHKSAGADDSTKNNMIKAWWDRGTFTSERYVTQDSNGTVSTGKADPIDWRQLEELFEIY